MRRLAPLRDRDVPATAAEECPVRFVDRVVLPRCGRGIDWGERRRLIARKGESILLFVVPGTLTPVCGVRGFGRKYVPTSLVLWRDRHERFAGHATDTLARGRISRSVLAAHADRIDAVFGVPGLAASLDLSKTALIETASPEREIARGR